MRTQPFVPLKPGCGQILQSCLRSVVFDVRKRSGAPDQKSIRYGLGAIKGTGAAAIESILAARAQDGPFVDLFDFCRRVDKRLVNRRVIEALVRSGAFDALSTHRASMLASVGIALEAAEKHERDAAQVSLFGGSNGEIGRAHV